MTALPTPKDPGFPTVTQYEVTERLLGGPGGPLNRAPAELLERTEFLKKQIDDIVSGALTAEYAGRLKTPRNIAITGDGSWSVTFDGNGNVSGPLTLANSGVTPGTWPMTTVDAKGRVTAGRALASADIPALEWSKITSGKPTTLAGYGIGDALPRNAPTVSGDISFDGNAGSLVRNFSGSLALHAGRYSFVESALDSHLCQNAYWDGVNWMRYDTSKPSAMLVVHDGQACVAEASSGNNPVSWPAYSQIWHAGNFNPDAKADKSSTLAGYGISDAASKWDLQNAIGGVLGNAPAGMETLQKIAASIGNDPQFITSMDRKIAKKSDKASSLAGYGIADAYTKQEVNGQFLTKNAPAINGDIHFDGSTSKVRNFGGSLALHAERFSFLNSPNDAHVCQNAYWDGATWMRYDVNSPSAMIVVSNGRAFMASGAPGPNPLSWSAYQELWSNGNSGFMAGVNGYQKLPSGLIIQWGYVAESQHVTDYRYFPIAFPNACCSLVQSFEASTIGGFEANFGMVYKVVDRTKFLWSGGGNLSTGGYCSFIATGH